VEKFGMGAQKELEFKLNEKTEGYSRRKFLWRSFMILTGSLWGTANVARALTLEGSNPAFRHTPKIALIIDDIGYSRSIAMQFLELNRPITYSILPQLDYSYELAVEMKTMGCETMLHQPMEPYSACCDPGPGALFVGLDASTIEEILTRNISSVPHAGGVNNHMGSRFTASAKEIKETLKVIKSKDLFFVDSFTSSRSVAYATAKSYHMPTAHRNIFIDNSRDESAILSQLYKLGQHAVTHGRALGIGHPYPETARAIKKFTQDLDRFKIDLVGVSEIL
jgi:polysaccharide deacetylase 2 family uncharacterized protein YibQ